MGKAQLQHTSVIGFRNLPWQPSPAPAVDHLRRAQEASSDRQRRRRPRVGRLVLVFGHAPGLSGPTADRGGQRPRPCSVRNDPPRGYEQPCPTTAFMPGTRRRPILDQRLPFPPNTRPCGNQPAHISLDHASTNDTLTGASTPMRHHLQPPPTWKARSARHP